MSVEPVTLVEIDLDMCWRVYGSAPCTAALSADNPRKCFNTFGTCQAEAAFASGVRTLRFAEPVPGLPKGATIFPALKSVTEHSATVNIAGSDDRLSALGRRATVSVIMRDFAYHDRLTDPYAAERVTGAAQWGGVGYDPAARGTFFGKLRARWPHYFGRALRVVQARLEGGALVVVSTRHYVLTDWALDEDGQRVRIEAKDVLALADDARAVCPKPARGVLAADLAAGIGSAALSPPGIGATYPVSGLAEIGGEVVSYARSGDSLWLDGRGLLGTTAKAATAGDTVQPVFSVAGARIDDVVEILLRDYAGVPQAYIPKAKWAAEVSRWLPQILLRADIAEPEGVAKLIGELAVLGVSIWWDNAAQEIALRANAPVDLSGVPVLSEDNYIKAARLEDRQADRLTDVFFYTVQKDPTKSATAADNYRRLAVTSDLEAKDARAYGDTRIRRIFCRWFNGGYDAAALTLSRRLLKRFRSAPLHVRLTLDDAAPVGLGDVVKLRAGLIQDDTGATPDRAVQVIQRAERPDRAEVEITCQAFDFVGRFAFATENGRPT